MGQVSTMHDIHKIVLPLPPASIDTNIAPAVTLADYVTITAPLLLRTYVCSTAHSAHEHAMQLFPQLFLARRTTELVVAGTS